MAEKRNRATEARDRGKRLCMFEMSAEASALIDQVKEQLAAQMGRCSRTQALERIVREGAKKILTIPCTGLDTV